MKQNSHPPSLLLPRIFRALCFFGFVSSRIRLPVPRLDATFNGMMRLSDPRWVGEFRDYSCGLERGSSSFRFLSVSRISRLSREHNASCPSRKREGKEEGGRQTETRIDLERDEPRIRRIRSFLMITAE